MHSDLVQEIKDDENIFNDSLLVEIKMRKYITRDEWAVFYLAVTESSMECRDKVMFRMAYEHGLRVSELNSIRLSDLDMAGHTIYINRLKNGLSTTHPIQNETYKLIQRWLEKRMEYIRQGNNVEWLFVSKNGRRISRQWIYKLSRKYSNRAGLVLNLHPHMLRHGCGYALADQGLDTRLIQDYLGHKNICHTVLYTASNSARFSRVWK